MAAIIACTVREANALYFILNDIHNLFLIIDIVPAWSWLFFNAKFDGKEVPRGFSQSVCMFFK